MKTISLLRRKLCKLNKKDTILHDNNIFPKTRPNKSNSGLITLPLKWSVVRSLQTVIGRKSFQSIGHHPFVQVCTALVGKCLDL